MCASAGRIARNAPSSTFSASPRPSAETGAEEPLGAALRDPAVELADEQRVGRDRAAQHLRVRAHRRDHARAAVERGQPGERVRAPVERQRERRHAAPVDRDRQSTTAATSAAAATSRSISCCSGCSQQAVPVRLAAARPADGEEAGVLAGAVVLDRGRRRRRTRDRPRSPVQPRGDARTAASCSGAARCDAQAIAISRSSRSGRARTSGSAWIGFADERRNVTSVGRRRRATIAPVPHRDRVHGVERLDDLAAGHLDVDRLQAASLDDHPRLYASSMPELPEVEAWVRELDPLVSRAPIEIAPAGPHRDREDVRPAARPRSPAARSRERGGAGRTSSSRPPTASSSSAST